MTLAALLADEQRLAQKLDELRRARDRVEKQLQDAEAAILAAEANLKKLYENRCALKDAPVVSLRAYRETEAHIAGNEIIAIGLMEEAGMLREMVLQHDININKTDVTICEVLAAQSDYGRVYYLGPKADK